VIRAAPRADALFLTWFGLIASMWAPGSVACQVSRLIVGRVTDIETSHGLEGARLVIEGTDLIVETDAEGRYRLSQSPTGPQTMRVIRIGYAALRRRVVVPAVGTLVVDFAMARSALNLPNLNVTADPLSRARGEVGTASVIEREAIRNQAATSLSGLLELLPGVPLQPPGLDGVQQFALRVVPISPGGGVFGAGAFQPSADALASFGTQVVLDGVPVSNNANLQSLGPRGELSFATSSGGGIDLRRLPATTIERVEVIRGIPSARFGDMTQGTVLVDTRAGTIDPEVLARLDARTVEASLVGGSDLFRNHTGSATLNLARTRVAPGQTDDQSWRITGQLAHRYERGRLRLDTRVDGFQLVEDRPESEIFPGLESRSRDNGLRLGERARLDLGGRARLELTAALEALRQRAFSRSNLVRGAQPFTNRLTEGRQTGKFVGGIYNARVDVEGDPRHLYSRLEFIADPAGPGRPGVFRTGLELRREWNEGPGFQFDIEFPPQVQFNGVNGYDRPRRFDDVPPLTTTGLYADHRAGWTLGRDGFLSIQGGLRLDLLHEGASWVSGIRDQVVQPRLALELAPRQWLRFRTGAGRLAKVPTLSSLYPGLQYYDLVNVNYFANNPAERLAVLTTRIVDRVNPDLGYITADKLEAGVETDLGDGTLLSLVFYRDLSRGAVGFLAQPASFLREHFRIVDSTIGTGRPPEYEVPAFSSDTVPVLVDRPANNLRLSTHGAELTAALPEIGPIRTRIALLGAWTRTELLNRDIELGNLFDDFQLSEQIPRTPYWEGSNRTGERLLLTTRVIHHQPAVGLVLTGIVQLHLHETRQTLGGTDTLSFAGYMTRSGELVPVPREQRGDPQYQDLRVSRTGVLTDQQKGPTDWLFSLQVAKTLPAGGRLSFYAFNAFDRTGNFGDRFTTARLYPSVRFGLEVTMPVVVWR
jgi:hypothetical protein